MLTAITDIILYIIDSRLNTELLMMNTVEIIYINKFKQLQYLVLTMQMLNEYKYLQKIIKQERFALTIALIKRTNGSFFMKLLLKSLFSV